MAIKGWMPDGKELTLFKEWMSEREEAVLSQDYIKFVAFYEKWRKKGFYQDPLPSQQVVEIMLRKAVLYMTNAPLELKLEARRWINEYLEKK